MELSIESKLSVSDIDHKYPNISHSFINEQLIKGIKVEMEHTDNPEVARKIALDHLHENPFYYEYLDKMEEELKSLDIDKHFQEIQTENYFERGGKFEAYEFNTPTGKESKLSYVQQVLVRTKSFKNWFGDWEIAARSYLLNAKTDFNKHYENVSKVIDMETLEPKVGFHGTSAEEEFYSFATNKETGAGRPYGYFAENREYSMNFVGKSNLLYAAFLNIRNPFIARDVNFTQRKMDWIDASVAILGRMAKDKFPYGGLEYNEELTRLSKVHESQIWGYLKKTYENEKYNFWLLMARDFQSEFKNFLISHGYDGIFADEQFKDPYDAKDPRQFTNTFIVFDAAQVKLADGRNLKFNPMSADIRYEKGGEIKNIVQQIGKLAAPFQKKLAEQRIAQLIKEGERVTKWDEQMIYLSLVYDLYTAIGNYLSKSDKLVGEISFYEGSGGSIEISAKIERDGIEYKFRTEMIVAGGYNIQRRHYRYIVHTDLKYNQSNSEAEAIDKEIKELKEKIKSEKKIEEYKKDIESYKNKIEEYKKQIEHNKKLTDEEIWEILNKEKDYRTEFYNLTWEEMVERQAPIVEMTKNKEGYEAYKYENYYIDGIKYWKNSNIDNLERRIRSYTDEIKKIDNKLQKAQGYEKGGDIENKYEHGAKLDTPYEEDAAPQVLSKGGKMKEMLLPNKYKSGGAIHNAEGVKDDAKKGGLFVGRSHATGGIKAYNVSTQQPIEVEGGEVIITKKAVDDGEKREFEGEMLTNKEILSRINESGGGVSFADGGEVHGCGCSGKKYNYGGETLEDYMIIKKMNDAYDMTFGKSVKYVNSLIEKLK